MSLYTGKYTSMNGRDDEVIYQVEQLAAAEKYGCLKNIPFLNECQGFLIGNTDANEPVLSEEAAAHSYNDDEINIRRNEEAGVNTEEEEVAQEKEK